MNKWGEALKAAGIRFAYHTHGYEFRPAGGAAKETLFDLLVRETKPEPGAGGSTPIRRTA